MANNKKISIDPKALLDKIKNMPKSELIAYAVILLGAILLIIGLLI
jgi:hypothetical protein